MKTSEFEALMTPQALDDLIRSSLPTDDGIGDDEEDRIEYFKKLIGYYFPKYFGKKSDLELFCTCLPNCRLPNGERTSLYYNDGSRWEDLPFAIYVSIELIEKESYMIFFVSDGMLYYRKYAVLLKK